MSGKRDRLGNQKGALVINNDIEGTSDLPANYRVDLNPTGLKASVFSQDGSGRMAIEGVVHTSGSICPERSSGQYSKLCKQRLLKSMVKDRVVKALETLPSQQRNRIQFKIDAPVLDTTVGDGGSSSLSTSEILTPESALSPTRDALGSSSGVSLVATTSSSLSVSGGDKKVKMDKEEVKNLIFHHFEEREFWPLKELNTHVRQPDGYLKEVMKELCVYHRKGLYKSCYELKPQYKHHHHEQEEQKE